MNNSLSAERQRYLRQQRRVRTAIHACQIGLLTAFLLIWELAAQWGWIDSFILSQPTRIVQTLSSMLREGLFYHIGVTVFETLTGFFVGAAGGIVLAIILWWSPFISRVSEPYLVVLNSLPKIALGPVIIVAVGAGTQAIIVMAVAISLVVTVLEMLNGFMHTDGEFLKMGRTFGATKAQLFFKIVLPSNLPTLFNSLKINIGLSLVGVIAGEFLVSKAGLGYLIVYGGQVFKLDLVMTGVLILAVVAALMYEAVSLLQKWVMHYQSH